MCCSSHVLQQGRIEPPKAARCALGYSKPHDSFDLLVLTTFALMKRADLSGNCWNPKLNSSIHLCSPSGMDWCHCLFDPWFCLKQLAGILHLACNTLGPDVTKTRNGLENGPENGLGFHALNTVSTQSHSKRTV